MKSDLSRDTFDPAKHLTRVIMQQGKVTLDADHNEQVSILLHYLWTLAGDVLGSAAAPKAGGGFVLSPVPGGSDGFFGIGKGRYYVDGILVENEADTTYAQQADYPLPDDDPLRSKPSSDRQVGPFLAYLDVWERHITWIEDSAIREVALGGPDTCNRAKVVWQVRLEVAPKLTEEQQAAVNNLKTRRGEILAGINSTENAAEKQKLEDELPQVEAELARIDPASCANIVGKLPRLSTGRMATRLDPGSQISDPCVMPPDSKYRGAENQLYRVEIHAPGPAGTATFKWSRDNGSVDTAWAGTAGHDLLVASTRGFESGTWVELSNETLDLQRRPGTLVKLVTVEAGVLTVDPAVPDAALTWMGPTSKVRRWDQVETEAEDSLLVQGAVPITTAADAADVGGAEWIDLEDGIQVRFVDGDFRTGDYWLIPARVATGTIEWPDLLTPPGPPEQPPHGVEDHYAPLGFVMWNSSALAWNVDNNCRCEFAPLNCVAPMPVT